MLAVTLTSVCVCVLFSPTQRRMQHVSNLSILVMYTMYFLAALFGYLTFYGEHLLFTT